MTFWETHPHLTAGTTKRAKVAPSKPSLQDAPARCNECGALDSSVMFGLCSFCESCLAPTKGTA